MGRGHRFISVVTRQPFISLPPRLPASLRALPQPLAASDTANGTRWCSLALLSSLLWQVA